MNARGSAASLTSLDALTLPAGGGGVGGSSPHRAVAHGFFERTCVDDGTFWIDYTKFMMGFSHVDVCFAFKNWHAQSFTNHFPADRKTSLRVCGTILTVRSATAQPTTLMVMALQPSKRGAWC